MSEPDKEWELVVSHWLPDVWTPGRYHRFKGMVSGLMVLWEPCQADDEGAEPIPCPPRSRALGFRVLEATKLYVAPSDKYPDEWYAWRADSATGQYDPDLLTAIVKAAAKLPAKEQP